MEMLYPVITDKTWQLVSATGFVVIAAAVAFLCYNAKLVFDESLYVIKDSYAYKLLISDSVKAVPVYEPIVETVRYHYSAGDGNKPHSDSVEYMTPEPKGAVLEYYRQFLSSQGYIPLQAESTLGANITYSNSEEKFNIGVLIQQGNNKVVVFHRQIDR